MNRQLTVDLEALMREIARYLAAVEVFRAELREPTWRPELQATVPAPEPALSEA